MMAFCACLKRTEADKLGAKVNFQVQVLETACVPGAIGSFSTQLKTAMVDVECLKLTETHVDAIFQPT